MTMRVAQLGVAMMLVGGVALAQAPAPTPGGTSQAPTAASQTKTKIGDSVQTKAPQLPKVEGGQQLDRVVAIVNGDLILDSDVDQDRRFEALLPYAQNGDKFTREKAIERLINRSLILQQAKQQPEDDISDDDVAKDIDDLKKQIAECEKTDCKSEAGWKSFLASQGFTEREFTKLWKQRLEALAFIEERFQLGIKITPEQVKTYYEQKMLPVYASKGVKAPPLEAISTRIQELLLQQQISGLLNDWLNSLRSQGSIVVLHPGGGAP